MLWWAYVAFSLVMVVAFLVWMARDDIRMRREPWRLSSAKFGFNFSRRGLWWTAFMWLPVINLVPFWLMGPGAVSQWRRNRKKNKG